MKLSIIVPALNEAENIGACLERLQPLRQSGHELIVVDGGSADETLAIAHSLADKVLVAPRGRAQQMNAGAGIASGEVLVFLHADTILPVQAADTIERACQRKCSDGVLWGRFDVRLSGRRMLYRLIEALINLRSRLTAVATGDQVIFIQRSLFQHVGGYPDIALMEDVAISKQLRSIARPFCLRPPVVTSSRRWEKQGIASTILLMWKLRLLYFCGVSPERLLKMYR